MLPLSKVPNPILAAVMPAPRQPLEVREFSRPDLPPGAALMRTARSEVCGTDVHLWHGRLTGVPFPIIPGHVSAGILECIRGPFRALDGSPLAEGDRAVFFDVHRTCGRCRACTIHGTPTRCASRRVYGITDSADEGLFGGWSQYIYLEPGVGVARLPETVSFDDYIGAGCGLLTAVHILERAALVPGETIVVQGIGAVGLSVIALSKRAGASAIFAIGDPSSRLALARQMGANTVFPLGSTTAAERETAIRDRTHGEGADVVVEAAGSARAIEEGLVLVRDGGRYIVAGHYTDVGPSTINAHRHINRKHLDIRGCWGSEPRHFLHALQLLQAHAATIPWRTIGARTYSLQSVGDALADAEALKIPKALVDPWQS